MYTYPYMNTYIDIYMYIYIYKYMHTYVVQSRTRSPRKPQIVSPRLFFFPNKDENFEKKNNLIKNRLRDANRTQVAHKASR